MSCVRMEAIFRSSKGTKLRVSILQAFCCAVLQVQITNLASFSKNLILHVTRCTTLIISTSNTENLMIPIGDDNSQPRLFPFVTGGNYGV